MPLLDSLGRADNGNPEDWLKHNDGNSQILVLHRRPEYHMAAAIEQGKIPSEALAKWQEQANELVQWLRKNRRRACLVETDALTAKNANLELLTERLGVELAEEPSAKLPLVKPLHLLYALQAVQQSEECQTLLAELQASTLPLLSKSFEAPAINPDAIAQSLNEQERDAENRFETLKTKVTEAERLSEILKADLKASDGKQSVRTQQIESLQQQVSETREEGSLLLEQLHLVQEELEASIHRHKAAKEKLVDREQELQQIKKNHEAISKSLKDEIHRAKQAEESAERLSNELKAANADIAELSEQRQQAEKTIEQQNQQVQALKQDLTAEQEENALMLEQLHIVQEELEKRFINDQQLTQELAEYRNEQDCALAAANYRIKCLQDELNQFKESASWKATAPARALTKPFSRPSPKKRTLKRQIRLVRESGLFNEGWYLVTYPDVAEKNVDPIEHYLKFGAEERRNPSPTFDTDWYLTTYPDVAEQGMNPLIHYIKFGQHEERSTSMHHYPMIPVLGPADSK